MAYDPADLRLPPWLLGLLNRLILLRMPLAPGWLFGVTRAGVMFIAAMLGIWAAALYSGNNLLYLCAAMMTAMMLAACLQAIRLLQRFPSVPDLPILQAGQFTVLRLPCSENDARTVPGSAMVEMNWQNEAGSFALAGRCSGGNIRLDGRLQPTCRGLFSNRQVQLHTSAPLGLFSLSAVRNAEFDMLVLPAPVSWAFNAGGREMANDQPSTSAGDEWRDLRAYVPGDSLSRIHWRKADGDSRNWIVKRFSSHEQGGSEHHLRVDLRLPAGSDHADFEQLLGRSLFWFEQQDESGGRLMLGQSEFNAGQPDQYRQAMIALASAQPESRPAAGCGGLLLSLIDRQS